MLVGLTACQPLLSYLIQNLFYKHLYDLRFLKLNVIVQLEFELSLTSFNKAGLLVFTACQPLLSYFVPKSVK